MFVTACSVDVIIVYRLMCTEGAVANRVLSDLSVVGTF